MDAATAKEVGENPSSTPPAVDKETGETATPNSASETAIEIEGHVAPPAKDGHDLSVGHRPPVSIWRSNLSKKQKSLPVTSRDGDGSQSSWPF